MDIPNMPSLADYFPPDTIFGKGGKDHKLHMAEWCDPPSILDGYIKLFSLLPRRVSMWYDGDPSLFIWKPEGEVWKYSFNEERWRYEGEWFASRLLQDGWNFKLQMAVMVGIQ